MEGWIKLHRKFCDWEWFNVSEMAHLFIYLLLNANHEDGSWNGISAKRGQLITGRKSLSRGTKISEQKIRTCLKRLEKTQELTIKSTKQYSIITICNYDNYQQKESDINQQNNQQLTIDQPTINHKQECKELKNEKNNTHVCEIFFKDFFEAYPGPKKSIKTEFENFIAQYEPTVAMNFLPALEREKKYKTALKNQNKLVPQWKNMSSWIDRKCWEQEFPDTEIEDPQAGKLISYSQMLRIIDSNKALTTGNFEPVRINGGVTMWKEIHIKNQVS